ncbi:MAG: hypothetical protein E7590_07480 [Ruminococcaceae bacterium]|nr:hypothetical protein [Oscillospiraceae bacterium]MBE6701902.1 hypothetical protein [Oscillospiraceae bacterium]
MAYNNFVPQLWAEKIDRDLNQNCVYAEDTNRQYEGTVKKCGDTVRITGVQKPTIRTLVTYSGGTRVGAGTSNIEGPETQTGTEVVLVIDQIRYFNFKVDDVDKAQALSGLMDALMAEANEALAGEVDKYLAHIHVTGSEADGYTAVTVDNATTDGVTVSTVTESSVTHDTILDAFDKAQQKLYEQNVNPSTEVVITIPPAVYRLFRKAYVLRDTDNSEIMKNGKVGKYGNMTVKLTNTVAKESDGEYHIQVKTKRAIAYAQPLRHVEAYRPEGGFADAVKGFILFGAKVVRPKEIVDLALTVATSAA